jgi:hypothetical protein
MAGRLFAVRYHGSTQRFLKGFIAGCEIAAEDIYSTNFAEMRVDEAKISVERRCWQISPCDRLLIMTVAIMLIKAHSTNDNRPGDELCGQFINALTRLRLYPSQKLPEDLMFMFVLLNRGIRIGRKRLKCHAHHCRHKYR